MRSERPRAAPEAEGAGDAGARLTLLRPIVADLKRWVLEAYPREACGLLIGLRHPDGARVERAVRARNLNEDRPEDRYDLDPGDFLAADSAARRDGLEVLGIWHSHPDHPARPSRTDLDAAWEGYAYLILSTSRQAVQEMRSFRLASGDFVEQPVTEADS